MGDHDQPVAANLLALDFTADTQNWQWEGDTIELLTGESSGLHLTATLDFPSRFLVGWSVGARTRSSEMPLPVRAR
jgi:hypothetical protein